MKSNSTHLVFLASLALGGSALGYHAAFAQDAAPVQTEQGQTQQGQTQQGQENGSTSDASGPTTAPATSTTTNPQDTTGQIQPSDGSTTTGAATNAEGAGAAGNQAGTDPSGTATDKDAKQSDAAKAADGASAETDGTVDADISITTEQRTEIRQVIRNVRVEPVQQVDFVVDAGIAVPRTIRLEPLPTEIVKIYPGYRDYRFFVLADGRIVIVNPSKYVIVTVITG